MNKWEYFGLGIKFGLSLLGIYALFFGEITMWPLERPLKEYRILFILAIILFVDMGLQALLEMVN